MNNRVHGGRVLPRAVRTAGLVVAAGLMALANGGSATAQPPGVSCDPATMMRAQADQMTSWPTIWPLTPTLATRSPPQTQPTHYRWSPPSETSKQIWPRAAACRWINPCPLA